MLLPTHKIYHAGIPSSLHQSSKIITWQVLYVYLSHMFHAWRDIRICFIFGGCQNMQRFGGLALPTLSLNVWCFFLRVVCKLRVKTYRCAFRLLFCFVWLVGFSHYLKKTSDKIVRTVGLSRNPKCRSKLMLKCTGHPPYSRMWIWPILTIIWNLPHRKG